ncbi:MAG: PKD domain-containing protein [Bacteroidota bacterium]
MKSSVIHIFFFSVLLCLSSQAQPWIEVSELDFNTLETNEFDEIAAVPYDDGLLFSWNRKTEVLRSDITEEENPLFDIYYVGRVDEENWSDPRLFSEDITTRFHEGPVALDPNGREIYFTQNINRSMRDDNYLGLYRASVSRNGITNPRPMDFNGEDYNVSYPAVSPDGELLFFASDMPGGHGGYDIYVCTRNRNRWSEPQNLGPTINTRGNEISPFFHSSGRLYFATNGLDGFGRHDIFFSEFIDGVYTTPQNLGEPINSKRDDYAIYLDNDLESGYFTSSRNRSHDIFYITSSFPELSECKQVEENNYCYKFKEENTLTEEMGTLGYEWDFGDGEKARGSVAEHCFPGPGTYLVQLNVIDSLTGDVYFSEATYNLVIEDIEQAYIEAPDTAFINTPVTFSGEESYMEQFEIRDYAWDFGDNNKAMGAVVTHTFLRPGNYTVKLGVLNKPEKNQEQQKACSYKNIIILPKNETSEDNMQ